MTECPAQGVERTLKDVSSKLREASRAREHPDIVTAREWLNMAQTQFDEYNKLLGKRLPAVAATYEYRRTKAELLLVQAMVHAHTRNLAQNNRAFNQAAHAAHHSDLPSYMQAQVLCCWGAVLIWHNQITHAIANLSGALKLFRETYDTDRGFVNEIAQTTYHLARAYCRCKDLENRRFAKQRFAKAIGLLEQVIPHTNPLNPQLRAATTKYQLAAMIMLAVLLQREGQKSTAWNLFCSAKIRAVDNNLLVVPHRSNGAYTIEAERLDAIGLGRFRYVRRNILYPTRTRKGSKWPEI